MKKQIYTFIGLLVVLTVTSAIAVHAQSVTTARANIPFDFEVRNQTIAAGDCVIKRQDAKGAVWLLSGKDGRQSAILAKDIESKRTFGGGKMTFRRYGNKYFLAGIETSAYRIGFQKSRAERSLEKKLKFDRAIKNKRNGTTPEIVAVTVKM